MGVRRDSGGSESRPNRNSLGASRRAAAEPRRGPQRGQGSGTGGMGPRVTAPPQVAPRTSVPPQVAPRVTPPVQAVPSVTPPPQVAPQARIPIQAAGPMPAPPRATTSLNGAPTTPQSMSQNLRGQVMNSPMVNPGAPGGNPRASGMGRMARAGGAAGILIGLGMLGQAIFNREQGGAEGAPTPVQAQSETAPMQPTPAPAPPPAAAAPRPAPRPAARAPQRAPEMSSDRLNEMSLNLSRGAPSGAANAQETMAAGNMQRRMGEMGMAKGGMAIPKMPSVKMPAPPKPKKPEAPKKPTLPGMPNLKPKINKMSKGGTTKGKSK